VSEHNKQKFEKQKVYDSFVEKILGKTNNDTVIL